MTALTPDSPLRKPPATDGVVWYGRPKLVIGVMAGLVLLASLFARTPVTGRSGDPRLSTFSSEPLGAKLLYELADRLGWDVSRDTRGVVPASATTVLSVLDPVIPVSATDAGAMLAHVRRGGALLLVLGQGTTSFSDSLQLSVDPAAAEVQANAGVLRPCARTDRPSFTREALWFGSPRLLALKGRGLATPALQRLIMLQREPSTITGGVRSALVGMPYGAGRLVVAADPDVFRNDAIRDCRYGLDVAAVRALQYLEAGGAIPRRQLLFDEVRQKRGKSLLNEAILRYLREVPSGRAILQLLLAGLVLMLAVAPRVLSPRGDARIERRSPLEHVDALARAYLQVGATRTGTQLLVRGLRRRLEGSGARAKRIGLDDDMLYLTRLVEVKPVLAGDIATVRHALTNTIGRGEFRQVGQAIQRIEAALTHT